MKTRFGPAGNSDSFTAKGYKKSAQVPQYLQEFGLSAFEYQCGRGVRLTAETAEPLCRAAAEADIALSLHAPYYISLSSLEEEKRQNSIRYILESARAVTQLGGQRIVVHSGACGKMSRTAALELAKETLKQAVQALDEQGYSHVIICPETMGKINQLGTLDEVLELCGVDERFLPCIDFGHLNARTFGGLKTPEDFRHVFEAMENKLGAERMKRFHSHFSKIEYTQNGGEKRHLTFEDTLFGPDFEPVAELVAQKGCTPVFICESSGTQAEDAAQMMKIYHTVLQSEGFAD